MDNVRREPYKSRIVTFGGHLNPKSKRKEKPEIDEVDGTEVLYRDGGSEVLGEVVREPYEENGSKWVDYRPLNQEYSRMIGYILEGEEERVEEEIDRCRGKIEDLSQPLEESKK
ncbi:MAG: hypothetical protein BRC29_03220 [Nanohaloarchaea archaeon SW_7_43_1]|nr:MAG: hypothetical protein BRC29_03220 [Nanohaloarchaea archaeon SW_7_43_1]